MCRVSGFGFSVGFEVYLEQSRPVEKGKDAKYHVQSPFSWVNYLL